MTSLVLIVAILAVTGTAIFALLWLSNRFPHHFGTTAFTLVIGSPFAFMAHLSGVPAIVIAGLAIIAIIAMTRFIRSVDGR